MTVKNMPHPINYMQTFALTNGAKRMITLPVRDNARLVIKSNNTIGLALDENDANGNSSNTFFFSCKLNDHPVIFNPPLLMDGQSIWIFEASGATTAQVSIWVTAGV